MTLTSVLVATSTICERIGKWIERYTKEITKKVIVNVEIANVMQSLHRQRIQRSRPQMAI